MDKKIVLLVEDNPDDEELTRIAFEECHLANELVVVRDGQEALDYLFLTGKYADRKMLDLPQVMLLDLKLPKVDGLEVLQRVRADERTKQLPVVVLTSSRHEQDLIDSYSLGASSYIQKPVDYLQFVEAVRQLGLYWLVLNQVSPTLKR